MKNPHQLETYLFLILDHPKKKHSKVKIFLFPKEANNNRQTFAYIQNIQLQIQKSSRD